MPLPLSETVSYTTECRTLNVKTTNADAYIELCEQLNCYELLPNDRKVKPYFDIEIKPKYCKTGEEYIDCYIDVVNIACQKINKHLPNSNFTVLNASSGSYICCETGEEKWIISNHIVVSNYKISKKQCLSIVKKMNQEKHCIDDYYQVNANFKLFDESVYDDNRKIRSALANKTFFNKETKKLIIENRPFKVEQGTIQQSIISAFFDENTIEIMDESETTSRSPSPTSVTQLSKETNKHSDLLQRIGNKGHKRNDWVTICGWFKVHSNKLAFLSFVDACWKDDAERMWDTMKEKDIPIYWIETFAKRTNPTVYREWLDINNIYFIEADQLDDPFKVAEIISKTLKTTLVLCNEQWYMLTEKQLWKQQKEPSFYIISELRKYIDESNKKIVYKISQSDGDAKDKLVEKSKIYLKSYKTISSSGFLNVLTKFLKTPLADNSFESKLDNNAGFLAFQNGILCLETKEFRAGIQSDDFITDTIPQDYQKGDAIKKQFIKDKLLEILNNNQEHLDYFLSLIGFSFIGNPHLEKSLYFCVDKTDKSSGDNGKTFFFDILSTLLPNYVYKTDKSFLEDGNKTIHKQLVKMKGKRLVWLDEFNEKKANAELMKVIGDGTQLENQVMFGTSELIDIMFKLWTLTNHIPNINAKDTAVYNRYKQVSYASHFDRTGKRTEANPSKLQFIADTSLGDKFKTEYRNEVIELVIDYANKYYKSKIPAIPEQFKKDTDATKMKNDEFATFFEEYCEADENEKVALKALVNRSGLSEKLVKEGMCRLDYKYDKDLMKLGKDDNGKYYKGGFIGCKLKPEEEQEEE